MTTRRSGRAPKPNALYAQTADLSFLDDDDIDVNASEQRPRKKRKTDSDSEDDFQASEGEQGSANEDEGASSGEEPYPDIDLGDDEQDDSDVSENSFDDDSGAENGYRRGQRGQFYSLRDANLPQPQALLSHSKAVSRRKVIGFLNGLDVEDTARIFSRLRSAEQDGVVPAKKRALPESAAAHRKPEDASVKAWFGSQIASGRFLRHQRLRSMARNEHATYEPEECPMGVSGAPGHERPPQRLERFKPVHLSGILLQSDQVKDQDSTVARRGWIIDTRESVHRIDWIPWSQDHVQYMAVVGRPDRAPAGTTEPDQDFKGSFEPQDPSPARIDVWLMETDRRDNDDDVMRTFAAMQRPARLLSLCSDFGAIVDMKWCPREMTSKKGGPLALLATVHGDGALRLFALDLPSASGTRSLQLIYLEKPSFVSHPEETVFTCVDWMSSTIIAAGCGNGFLAAWDLQSHFDSDEETENAEPFFYELTHASYVLAISVCRPTCPWMVASTSVDGTWRVTDIRSPGFDQIEGQRTRLAADAAQWYDPILGFLTVEDQPRVRAAPMRRIAFSNTVLNTESMVSCIATSPVHNSVIVGTTDGTTTIMNPAMMWWRGRRHYPYRLKWFQHEWKPWSELKESEGLIPDKDYPHGASQFSSGFKVEKDVSEGVPERLKNLKPVKGVEPLDIETLMTSTIYRKETNITALRWNPNACAGGWAAAGLGSGLVYLEDVSWA